MYGCVWRCVRERAREEREGGGVVSYWWLCSLSRKSYSSRESRTTPSYRQSLSPFLSFSITNASLAQYRSTSDLRARWPTKPMPSCCSTNVTPHLYYMQFEFSVIDSLKPSSSNSSRNKIPRDRGGAVRDVCCASVTPGRLGRCSCSTRLTSYRLSRP